MKPGDLVRAVLRTAERLALWSAPDHQAQPPMRVTVRIDDQQTALVISVLDEAWVMVLAGGGCGWQKVRHFVPAEGR